MSQRHKRALIAALVGLALGGCSSSTNDQLNAVGSNSDDRDGVNIDSDGQVHIGADASVDLAIFLKPAVRDEEISGFIQTTLNRPVPGGRLGDEFDLLPGMQSTLADYDRHAVYVGFFDNATPEERQAVKDAALASPLVDRIEEGIIPAQKYPRP